MRSLRISILAGRYGIVRLAAGSPVLPWMLEPCEFASITRAPGELSLTVKETRIPEGTLADRGWRAFRLHGPFSFELTGVLASVADPLRDAGIGIFAISTYDTDYVLVKESNLARAVASLLAAGHSVETEGVG